MGQTSSSCDCGQDESRINLESYIEPPNITKEDVKQIWKCFEYLKPKNGVVLHKNLLESKDNTPVYMKEIIEMVL